MHRLERITGISGFIARSLRPSKYTPGGTKSTTTGAKVSGTIDHRTGMAMEGRYQFG